MEPYLPQCRPHPRPATPADPSFPFRPTESADGKSVNYKLFCANEDAERQRWEGSRLGPKDQKTLMADCVEPLSHFPSYVREIHTQNRPVVLDAKMWHGHPYASQVLDPRHTTLAKVSKKRERERWKEGERKWRPSRGRARGADDPDALFSSLLHFHPKTNQRIQLAGATWNRCLAHPSHTISWSHWCTS